MRPAIWGYITALLSLPVYAETAASPIEPINAHTILSMFGTLLLIVGALLLVKKIVLHKRLHTSSTPHMKIVSVQSLSMRDKILILEVDDTWIIVGVTAQHMNTLYTTRKPEHTISATHESPSLSRWLKNMVDKK